MNRSLLVAMALVFVPTAAAAQAAKDQKKAAAALSAPKPVVAPPPGATSTPPGAGAPTPPNPPTPPTPPNPAGAPTSVNPAPPSCQPSKDTPALPDADLAKLCERKAIAKMRAASTCGSDAGDFASSLDSACEELTQKHALPKDTPRSAPEAPVDAKAMQKLAAIYQASKAALPRKPAAPSFATPQVASTPAGLFAQGLGDFLTQRAEQEVSAYATVELFSRACSSELKGVLVKTCDLLGAQGGGADPVGLGVLRRAITYDLEHSPQSLLKAVVNRVKNQTQLDALCMVDVGVALNSGLLKEHDISPLLELEPPANTDLHLKVYSVLSPLGGTSLTTACDPTWKSLTNAIKGSETSAAPSDIAGEVLAIDADLLALQSQTDTVKIHDLHADIATRIASLINAAVPSARQGVLDDLANIATAIWDKDWIGVVSATASADTLGPILLCGDMSKSELDAKTECQRDEKARLVLSVVADIAQATTSDAVQAALNRIAEPIGTWRRKFDGFTFSLNGYAGAKLAYENVPGSPPEGLAFAPVLAVGLDLSWHLGPNQHWGVFFQAVDVGNVASVRLAEKDSSSLTKVDATTDIKVVQLFAPGAYFMIAPARAPFAIGVGGDWVPALRQTGDGQLHPAWHAGLMLAVDVPILELHHQ